MTNSKSCESVISWSSGTRPGKVGWPLTFLDLESTQMAVPPYDGVRPYQQLPHQLSVHVQSSSKADIDHHESLADGPEDPKEAFMVALQRANPGEGSIVIYNASFDEGGLNACADAFPEFRPWVDSVLPCFVDLLVPFRNFSYYLDQHGSASQIPPGGIRFGFQAPRFAHESQAFCKGRTSPPITAHHRPSPIITDHHRLTLEFQLAKQLSIEGLDPAHRIFGLSTNSFRRAVLTCLSGRGTWRMRLIR